MQIRHVKSTWHQPSVRTQATPPTFIASTTMNRIQSTHSSSTWAWKRRRSFCKPAATRRIYGKWSLCLPDLRRSRRSRLFGPDRPDAMAIKEVAMSREVSQKMGVKEGMRVFFLNASQSALNAINLPGLAVDATWSGLKFTHPKKDKIYRNSHGQLKR